jgi:hypothetical protein
VVVVFRIAGMRLIRGSHRDRMISGMIAGDLRERASAEVR